MKSARGIMILFVCFAVFPGGSWAQSTASEHDAIASVPTNIHQLFMDDQSERTVRGFVLKYGSDVNSRDAMRRAEAKSLLAAGELKSAQDFHDAAFIFQHGHEPDDYLLAHILAIDAIAKGDAASKWIAAATLDRYLQAIGQKQVFGTQYLSGTYAYYLAHKDDRDAMNRPEAQQKGNTQEPYDGTLLSDALRGDFCVPDQGAQVINLEELNAGKPMTGEAPSGCGH